MSDDRFHDAVKALYAIDGQVEPTGDALALWLVRGHDGTDGELIALAHRFGLVEEPGRVQ